MLEQFILLAQLATSAPSYDDAKALADKQEASLSAEKTAQLQAAQSRSAGAAFAACVPTPRPPTLPSFTVVMQLDASGRVSHTWLKGDSAFAQCVEHALSTATLFGPPSAPFYTSFEYTFAP